MEFNYVKVYFELGKAPIAVIFNWCKSFKNPIKQSHNKTAVFVTFK